MPKWHHETSVSVRTTPEDEEDISVRLYVRGSHETSDYFDEAFGNFLPGDPAVIELLGVEIFDGPKYRKALPAIYPDSFDQYVLDAVEAWWDERAGECWESLEEGDQ